MNIVAVVYDNIDKHGVECTCDLCEHLTGKSYGVNIYKLSDELVDKIKKFHKTYGADGDWKEYFECELDELEPYQKVYACSYESAYRNALLICEENKFIEISDIIENNN